MNTRNIITMLTIFVATTTATAKRYNEFTTPQEKGLNIQYISEPGLSGADIDHLYTDKDYLKNEQPAQYGWFRPGATVWWNTKWHYHHDDNYQNIVRHTDRAQPQISPDGKRMIFFESQVISIDLGNGINTYLDVFDNIPKNTHEKKHLRAGSFADNNTMFIYTDSATYQVSISDKKKEAQLLEGLKGYVQQHANSKTLYCEDDDGNVWKYDRMTHTQERLASNAREINLHGDDLYFRRNSEQGISEIWRINVKTLKEEKVLSSTEHGFSSPQISPDGKYIAVHGNALSPISKKQNLDIFIAKTDGTGLRQLTDHPANDEFPIWSIYGNKIYFLSQRRIDGSKYDEYSGGWLYSMDIKQVLEEMK